MQEAVIKECGCVDTMLPFPKGYSMQNLQGVKYCGDIEPLAPECGFNGSLVKPPEYCLEPLWKMKENIQCGRDVQARMENTKTLMEDCNCYTPCDDVKYKVQYSLSGWPPGPEMDSIYAEIMADFPAKFAATNPSKIKQEIYWKHFSFLNRHEAFKDISKINVYIADTSVTKTTQSPDYQFGDLLSDAGGQMGFWVRI